MSITVYILLPQSLAAIFKTHYRSFMTASVIDKPSAVTKMLIDQGEGTYSV